MQIKPMAPKGGDTPERFRVIFSDSENFIQTMLATRRCIDNNCGDIFLTILKKSTILSLAMP
jgi:hypothetical protein